MATISFIRSITINYTAPPKSSLFKNFINWCTDQQENRLLWLGIALAGHGCIITPITIMAVVLAGTNLVLFMLALVAMAIALVTNLAALPTRITIPALVLSILIEVGVIIACAVNGFSLSNIF